MADAETEFGQRLRVSLDTAAKTAARAVVNERFEKFGSDVVGWADRAARDAVLRATSDAVMPFHAAIGRLQGQFAEADAKLVKHADLLAAVDLARLRNDYDELEIAKGRLEKSRGEIMAQIRAASFAMTKEAEQILKLGGDLVAARMDVSSLATSLAARIEAVHGDVAKVAEEAAEAAVERLKGDVLAEMDAMTEEMRGLLTEDLTKFRKASAVLLSDALDAISKRHSDDAGLLLSRFRGPHEEGEAYARGDIATFQGSTWIAKRAPEGVLPSTDPQGPWALFASGGIGKAR